MIIIRLDDAATYMDIERWTRVEDILDKYGVKPLVGVVPDIKDPKMIEVYKEDKNFWKKVKQWENKEWIIAMHGYDHLYISSNGGLNPKCSVSEFAGVPLDIQESKIRRGIKIFNSHDIRPKVFFAPSHTFDENTLMAIKNNSDIRIISDTVSNDVYYENDFYYVPQQVGHEANLPFKVVTICYHPNMMEEEDFIRFEKFIERYQDKCLKNSEEFNKILRKRKKSFYDKLLSSCYLILRKMRGLDK